MTLWSSVQGTFSFRVPVSRFNDWHFDADLFGSHAVFVKLRKAALIRGSLRLINLLSAKSELQVDDACWYVSLVCRIMKQAESI